MTDTPQPQILWIETFGQEPGRRGARYEVGSTIGPHHIAKIEYRDVYHGDHSIGWYDIHADGIVKHSIQERAVAEMRYAS